MLYITSPCLTYFITGSLYLWTPFTHFSCSLPPASGDHPYFLSVYVSVLFDLVWLYIPYVSEVICLVHWEDLEGSGGEGGGRGDRDGEHM